MFFHYHGRFNDRFYISMEQVRLERESLSMARTKIAQVTTELKEKESILSAIKKEMMAEQENLLDKVKLFTKCCYRIRG